MAVVAVVCSVAVVVVFSGSGGKLVVFRGNDGSAWWQW